MKEKTLKYKLCCFNCICVCAFAFIVLTLNNSCNKEIVNSNQDNKVALFEKKFAQITNGLDRNEVASLVGKPDKIEYVDDLLEKKVSSFLPYELWYYSLGEKTYMIRFSPPTLFDVDNKNEWLVDVVGLPGDSREKQN